MEKQKDLLGHVYGSRMAKSGNYLNLIVVIDEGGERRFVQVPIGTKPTDRKAPVAKVENGYVNIEGVKLFGITTEERHGFAKESDPLPF